MPCRLLVAFVAGALLLANAPSSAAGDTKPAAQPPSGHQGMPPAVSGKVKRVDINSASPAELKAALGVDDAMANKIVKGRPYPTRSHLVTKNVMPFEVYSALKDRMVAVQPAPTKTKK